LDPKRVYGADPKPAPERQRKTTSAGIKSIHEDVAFTEATGKLRYLETGLAQIQNQIDELQIERYLAFKPNDRKARELGQQLSKRKLSMPQNAVAASAKSNEPAAVTAALELLRRPESPVRLDRDATIRRLEDDANLVSAAIGAQTQIVDEIRDALSVETVRRLSDTHRKLVLQQFRCAQQLAAATDALLSLRSDVASAGYTWRPDLLPEPPMRSALILGSESGLAQDTEICRTRRLLEEWKIL
jgi:hypothetical protein